MQSHHMLAQKACKDSPGETPVRFLDGTEVNLKTDVPCIRMEARDHINTVGWGPSHKSDAYRSIQRSFMIQGNFQEAFYMDAEHVLNNFQQENGQAKYANEVALAEKKLLELEQQQKVTLDEQVKEEISKRLEQLHAIELKELKLNEERHQQLKEEVEQRLQVVEAIKAEKERLEKEQRDAEKAQLEKDLKLKQEALKEYQRQLERLDDIEKRAKEHLGEEKLREHLKELESRSREELQQQHDLERAQLEQSLMQQVAAYQEDIRNQTNAYKEEKRQQQDREAVKGVEQLQSQYQTYDQKNTSFSQGY